MYSLQQLQNDFTQKLTDRYTLSEAKTLFFMLLKERKGWDSTYFFLHSQEPVSSELRDCLKSDILRLQSGEPIQYLLKQVKFLMKQKQEGMLQAVKSSSHIRNNIPLTK